MEADLKGFIKVYDGVLDENFCRNAIKVATETEAERGTKMVVHRST